MQELGAECCEEGGEGFFERGGVAGVGEERDLACQEMGSVSVAHVSPL